MGINMKLAMAYFNKGVGTVSWLSPKGTAVKYSVKGNNIFKEVIRKDGYKAVAKFDGNGKFLLNLDELSNRGRITHSFGASNYDKVVEASTNDGKLFTFLGHQKHRNGILYSNISGRYGANNNYLPQYKTAMNYIRNKASIAEYISSILRH